MGCSDQSSGDPDITLDLNVSMLFAQGGFGGRDYEKFNQWNSQDWHDLAEAMGGLRLGSTVPFTVFLSFSFDHVALD